MAKLNCNDVLQYMDDYIDGEMDSELKKEMDLHLQKCDICHQIMMSHEKTINLLKKAMEIEPDQKMMIRIKNYLNSHLSKH